MIVNKQKNITFKNECNCIVDENILKKSIEWYQRKPTSSNKKIYLHGKYPCISIHDKKIHVHRLIVSYLEQRILDTKEYVHHKNHNKLDASINNLEIMSMSIHQSYHTTNRIFSNEHKQRISESNRRRTGIKMKKRINIHLGLLKQMLLNGKSIFAISKHFDCDWSTIKNRINENPELLEIKS